MLKVVISLLSLEGPNNKSKVNEDKLNALEPNVTLLRIEG